MNNAKIDTYLGIIEAEMMVERLETFDRNFIKQVVLIAGGKVADIDDIIKHPSVKEIDYDLFYIKTSAS